MFLGNMGDVECERMSPKEREKMRIASLPPPSVLADVNLDNMSYDRARQIMDEHFGGGGGSGSGRGSGSSDLFSLATCTLLVAIAVVSTASVVVNLKALRKERKERQQASQEMSIEGDKSAGSRAKFNALKKGLQEHKKRHKSSAMNVFLDPAVVASNRTLPGKFDVKMRYLGR